MASPSSLVFVLFLVLVGASTLTAYHVYPILYLDSQKVQNVGKFAVDEYNKKGESHLNFIEVVNGTVIEEAYFLHTWYLELKAANCSQSDTQALYLAQIFEKLVYGPDGSRKPEFITGSFYRE